MKVYWQRSRKGERLILASEDDDESIVEIGGVRETKRGFDAFAKTFGYEPGRAEKGISSMQEAKAFVEGFTPWDLFEGGQGLAVDPTVREQANAS
jgi:hypothetical protein